MENWTHLIVLLCWNVYFPLTGLPENAICLESNMVSNMVYFGQPDKIISRDARSKLGIWEAYHIT